MRSCVIALQLLSNDGLYCFRCSATWEMAIGQCERVVDLDLLYECTLLNLPNLPAADALNILEARCNPHSSFCTV